MVRYLLVFRKYDADGRVVPNSPVIEREIFSEEERASVRAELLAEGYEMEAAFLEGEY